MVMRFYRLALLTSIVLVMSGCGDNGNNDESFPLDTPTTEAETFRGQFIDSPVTGLRYETASQSGSTDDEGEFVYQAGELITFSIGGTSFPAVPAASVITPLDIFQSSDVNNIAVVNLLRLLQSLDTDGVANNGIQIDDRVHVLAEGLSLDFTSPDFENSVSGLLIASNGVNTILVSAQQAVEHFQDSLGIVVTDCGSSSSKVGYSGSFQTLAHNVSGTATILDDCSFSISNFNYDGGGPAVYFYGAQGNDFSGASAFSMGSLLTGQVFNDATLTVVLPDGKTFDDFDSISVWCEDFNANFGDLKFLP